MKYYPRDADLLQSAVRLLIAVNDSNRFDIERMLSTVSVIQETWFWLYDQRRKAISDNSKLELISILLTERYRR